MSDVPTSANVAGTASPSSSRTGRPVAMLRPQSPRTNRASQMAYCAARGRSSPRARRWAASCSGVAVGPSRRSTGSPGARRTSKHVSVNPLLTVHPFAKQVERYVLLTTLVRYDSALVPRPYLARAWTWSEDRKSLTFRLQPGVRWGDGVPTTARDVAWTLSAARDAATGYPRLNDFADVAFVNDPDD